MIIIMFCIYITVYSPELAEFLSTGWHDETGLADLEEKLISSIANSNKNSFNYLLLDPRITKDIPSRMNSLG